MEPLIRFGVLTDVQYANCDNRLPTDISGTRYYRGALNQVDKAFKTWKQNKAKFVLQLGDVLDGVNKRLGISSTSLAEVLSRFESHPSIPTFHTVGNHDLTNFKKTELSKLFYESMKKLTIPPEIYCPMEPLLEETTPVFYYQFSPHPDLKFICLDCYDISILGYDKEHPKYQEAYSKLHEKHNHHISGDEYCSCIFKGLEWRFQAQNGAISKTQLKWLEEELRLSDKKSQKVIVFGHSSIHPDSGQESCIVWNYEEVMATLHRHSCVLAYLSGHTHMSGYAVDTKGINYIVFSSIVETPPEESAFATVTLYDNYLEITGHGVEKSYHIPLTNHHRRSSINVAESEVDNTTTVKVEA